MFRLSPEQIKWVIQEKETTKRMIDLDPKHFGDKFYLMRRLELLGLISTIHNIGVAEDKVKKNEDK